MGRGRRIEISSWEIWEGATSNVFYTRQVPGNITVRGVHSIVRQPQRAHPILELDSHRNWISILMVVTIRIINGSQTSGALQLRVVLDTAGFLCCQLKVQPRPNYLFTLWHAVRVSIQDYETNYLLLLFPGYLATPNASL